MGFSGLMNPDNRFGRVCGRIGNLIIVNLLFVLTLVPVITAGAGFSAMYYCVLKLIREGDIQPFRCFFKSFRENFKYATLTWLLLSGIAFALFLDFRIAAYMGSWAHGLWIGLAGVALIVLLVAMYFFPVLAAFHGTWKELVRNSVYFIGKNIFVALLVALVNVVPLYLTYRFVGFLPLFAFLWVMFGFALVAYCNAQLLLGLFTPHLQPLAIPEEEQTGRSEKQILKELRMLE